uniref:Kri1-like C-terminal domain-containing protein n=1 Tax=Homalodisca liturata TaxID=320908 RepID=A0A1B6IX78_9HEMI
MKSEKKLLKAELSEDYSSDSSIDDEDGELLTEELEEGFYKVLSRLKKKDPKLYDENIKYFPAQLSENLSELKNKGGKKYSEYKEWLKGLKDQVEDDGVKNDLEALHDFWSNPSLNKGEQFLRDYILNKKFLDPDDDFNVEKEIEKLEEEEKEIEEQVKFEHSYNCRFENPEEEFLQKYPNTMKKATGKRDNDTDGNDSSLNNSQTVKTPKKMKKLKENVGNREPVEVDEIEINNKLTKVVSNKKVSPKKRKILEDSTELEDPADVDSLKKVKEVINKENRKSPKGKKIFKEDLNEQSPKKKKLDQKEENEKPTPQKEEKQVKRKRRSRPRKRNSLGTDTPQKPEKTDENNEVSLSNKKENPSVKEQLSSSSLEQNVKEKLTHRNRRRSKKLKNIKNILAEEPGILEVKKGNKIRKFRHKQLLKLLELQKQQTETVKMKTKDSKSEVLEELQPVTDEKERKKILQQQLMLKIKELQNIQSQIENLKTKNPPKKYVKNILQQPSNFKLTSVNRRKKRLRRQKSAA